MKKRVLIIGRSGFVSTHLFQKLSNQFDVILTGKVQLEKDACKAILQEVMPQYSIYAVGFHNLEYAEKNQKLCDHYHSTSAVHFMEACNFVKSRFIYLSSDYVFSGLKGNFNENEPTGPITQLGKSKLAAENQIRTRSLDYIIIRSSLLLGRGTVQHPSWIDKIREDILLNKTIKLNHSTFRNPIHIQALSEAITNVIQSNLKNITIHLGGLTKISEYELANKIFEYNHFEKEIGQFELDYSLNFSQSMQKINMKAYQLEEILSAIQEICS